MQLALTKLASPLQPLTSRLPPLPTPAPSSSTESELVTRLLQHIEPYSTLGLALARKTWTNMCTQDSAVDRAFVIALGYLTIGVVSALWCYRESQLERPWSRRIQRHIENAGLLLKVAMFILVELIAFPIVCGACIDIVSLPLWKDASLNSRIVFQLSAPYSSTFFHWAAGTIFSEF